MLNTLLTADEMSLHLVKEEMKLRETTEVFLLFTMGSQYDHLIMQRMESIGVYCVAANPCTMTSDDVLKVNPVGIIISGGPMSMYSEPPPFDIKIFKLGIPVFGICLGFQLWAKFLNCSVVPAKKKEYGQHKAFIRDSSSLFFGMPEETKVHESHGDIVQANVSLHILAVTANSPVAAAEHGHLFGTQFHPEVIPETEHGLTIFENFCFRICKAKDRYPAQNVAQRKIDFVRSMCAWKKGLHALSGGSDSSIVAFIYKEAFGKTIGLHRAVYIKGIDRKDDERSVREHFGNEPWLELVVVDATVRFTQELTGIGPMKEKRVAMRRVYKAILEEQIADFGAEFITQGTLYTDLSESGGGYQTGGARKARIKLHHNVNLGFPVPEILPLIDMVKDNARSIGRILGVPEDLLHRHPFPGPGMLARIEPPFTEERNRMTQAADEIWIEELRANNLYHTVWQAGATLLNSEATVSKGDDAGKEAVICLWAFWSTNGFTAQAAELPTGVVKRVAQRIANEVAGVARVLYNYTDKPPGTIEWG